MGLSPMMQQYKDVQNKHKDCLILFRLGDFYELFFEDAVLASRELELTLTGKNCGMEERAPMCGVPYHAADSYITKLVENGHKVAVCEQMEDPAQAKGLVRRDVVQIITPGTLTIPGAVKENENIYIASVYCSNEKTSVCYADITTGQMFATDFTDNTSFDNLMNELIKISPKEIILPEEFKKRLNSELIEQQLQTYINAVDDSYFNSTTSVEAIYNQFNINTLLPLGIEDRKEIIVSAGALLLYLIDTQKQNLAQIKELEVLDLENHMVLDKATIRNLELTETMYDKKVRGSLLGVIDKTSTAMGSRLLKRFIKEPLNNSDEINQRLDAVEAIVSKVLIKNSISASLKKIYDFERLTARIASGRANGKDLIALKTTLSVLPDIKEQLTYLDTDMIKNINSTMKEFKDLYNMIDESIVEDPPFVISEGSLIKKGYSEELDALKDSIKDGKLWIANLESMEKERTGIKNLKVGFNRVFGYYIDVTKSNISNIPDNYIRKQTLVNSERYVTPELKENESKVLSAESKINEMEYQIFRQIRTNIEPYIKDLQISSKAVALLDVLISFADTAINNNYCRPLVNDSDILKIAGGRHPSVEQIIGQGMFVSNDANLDIGGDSMLIITGPNMSGKSTYMRQTAIIVLMAQIGSFVPCTSAEIGVVDRVFTRIGASDNLSYGQSTFFIEMSELANILRNSTSRSLIILDEIGRGTSTFDGLSIAWATIEYLCKPDKRIRTMFATHYHELTALEDSYTNIRNLSVDVSESHGNVVFLHKIVNGPASKSYGIHVAKIAGVPREVRKNAFTKLQQLESTKNHQENKTKQLSLFDSTPENEYEDIIYRIRHIDVNNLTPLDALLTLKKLQTELDDD